MIYHELQRQSSALVVPIKRIAIVIDIRGTQHTISTTCAHTIHRSSISFTCICSGKVNSTILVGTTIYETTRNTTYQVTY